MNTFPSQPSSASLHAVALLSILASGLAAGAARATTYVGDPGNPAALPQAVQDAYSSGERNIVINPGTYNLPSYKGSAFYLGYWSDATISAYNVTIIASDQTWGDWLFAFDHCNNVSLLGANLTQSTMTAYQGRIVATGSSGKGHYYVNWQPDNGFPVPDSPSATIDTFFVDGASHYIKPGTWDLWGAAHTALGNNTWQIDLGASSMSLQVNDYVVGRYGNAPFKIELWCSTNCVIRDVTMSRNGFAPIREEGLGGGGNRLINVTWTPGAPPSGSNVTPLVSGAADGLHSTQQNPGPDIESCKFEGVILDDCIAIHGYLQTVTSASGNTITLDGTGAGLSANQPVRIGNSSGFYADANCTAIDGNTLTLDRDLAVPVGAKVSNPLTNGQGYKIVNCQIGGTRSRGILVKADNGLIQGNLIAHCGSGISSGPEYYWGEGDYAHGVVVAQNLISSTVSGPAIWIHGEGAQGNQQITITSNTVIGTYQGDEISVEWTSSSTISGNSTTGNNSQGNVVTLDNDTNVILSGNVAQDSSGYANLLNVGAGVTNLSGNDSSGIKAIDATIPNGLYVIVGRGSGMALDVNGAGTANGSPIIQWPYHGGDNQKWIVSAFDSNLYRIQGLQSGRVLDVPGASTQKGAKLQIWDSNSGANQQWSFTATSGGYYTITSLNSSQVVDVTSNSTTAGTGIEQWPLNNGYNQQWSLEAQ